MNYLSGKLNVSRVFPCEPEAYFNRRTPLAQTYFRSSSPQEIERIDEILNEALELEPDRRDLFIVRACGPDKALRERVRSLLNLHKTAPPEEFLQPSRYTRRLTDLLRQQFPKSEK